MKDNDRTALHARVPHVLPGVRNVDKTPTSLLIQYSPREIAAQITILTSHVHHYLTGPELIGQRWNTEEAVFIPNFIQYRDFFSQVNNWVSYAIVSEGDLERRSLNLAAMIFVCDELHKMRNWDMLVAVYGGLRDPSVERLHHTWSSLPRDVIEVSTKLQNLLNPDAGYKTLKDIMREGKRPQFPCIAVFIEDLVELESEKNSQQGFVNFGRCLQQYQLLQYLLLGRDMRVSHLVRNDYLMGSFSFWDPVDSSVLMELSNRIEGN
ncbi:guanine nucleotide releasing protein [Trypanosoma theileri]|uniref:Guanine nucleotide releasing protein n=1 Tax=Trypanosoma theileri TaxID=67003 RepID=A0A1X0P4R3_9TRYP|nr:guanine nucleotide releasing protein [Trypanosoma theileri]ORC91821.1 guanine nucleotide releasing protein [Trypanosoma theileri]